MKFPFYDAPNTATITCCHILENGEPILYVSHDEDDGMWQFLCGKAHETDEAKLVSLKSVFDLDNSVGILKDMSNSLERANNGNKAENIILKENIRGTNGRGTSAFDDAANQYIE